MLIDTCAIKSELISIRGLIRIIQLGIKYFYLNENICLAPFRV